VAVAGLQRAGVLEARGGKVRLLRREEMPSDWDPSSDSRVPIWEVLQHLIARLEQAGVAGAGALLAQIGDDMGERSKELAVRLYEICERRNWAKDGFSYNEFAKEYPDIQRMMTEEAARYDNLVREYPEIQSEARRIRQEQLGLGI
jgi:putative DNA methylase